MGPRAKANPPRKRGPKPDRQALPGSWQEAVGKPKKKKRPERGWPKPANQKGRGK